MTNPCSISLHMPPNIDPTKATLAYGNLALQRLNRELNNDCYKIRQKAVRTLCDYLHDQEHIVSAIHQNIISSLKNLLTDSDIPTRAMSAECFIVMCQNAMAREAFLKEGVLDVMKELFHQDQPEIVRLNAHKTVERFALYPIHAQSIVSHQLIPILIDCAYREVKEIKVVILNTLNICLSLNTTDGLKANGMKIFTDLLFHTDAQVRSKSAQVILKLCVDPAGKQQAITTETIPTLVQLLSDEDTEAKASSAGALAFCCVITHGRYTAINCNAIPSLLALLTNENSRVRVNALKAITCISEAPEGRRILLDHIKEIDRLLEDDNAGVRKHAKIASEVITWKPGEQIARSLKNMCT